MANEYRRMHLTGPSSGTWEALPLELAERLPAAGVGSVADPRSDAYVYIERRTDGGPWATFSYWQGALDCWKRARAMEIETLENHRCRLLENADRTLASAGADIEGAKAALVAAGQRLKDAQLAEKGQRQLATDLQRKATAISELLGPLCHELDGVTPPPAGVEATVA